MKKFDKDKYLKKLKLKRKWRSYSRYVYIAVPCVLCCLLCLYFAYSKFFVSKENEVARTTVAPFIQGDIVISVYIDGEYSSTIPGKNDGYVVDKVSCDNGAVGEWNNDDWGLLTTNLSKRTKCNVYFKKVVSKVSDIIAQLDTTGKCPTMNDDGSAIVTAAESLDGYLCKAKDAYGDSYYYRGNVTNNYVKFADKYWRIVRINGDDSVRLIYDGTVAHANGEASDDRQIGTSAFNDYPKYNANDMYAGYMYRTGSSVQENTNDSTIKLFVDDWYENNIKGTIYEKLLTDNIFCNDRSISNSRPRGWATDGNVTFRWVYFPNGKYNNNMMLTCLQQNDAFTVSDTENGNGALKYPIGLLTADEVVLAGGWNEANNNYYLYSGQNWWTLSPKGSILISAVINIIINYDGTAYTEGNTKNAYGVRPVLNLKPEAIKYGDGTASNPYRLTESLDNSSSSESGGIDTGD